MPSRLPTCSLQSARLYDGNPKDPPGSTVLVWVFLIPPTLLAVALALAAFFQAVSPPPLLPPPSSQPLPSPMPTPGQQPSRLPSTTTSVPAPHTTINSDLQALRVEKHRLQRQVQSNQLQRKKLEQATLSSQQEVRIAEAAIHNNQSKLALTQRGLQEFRWQTQRALAQRAMLQDAQHGGALAESLDSLPQWAIALVTGLLGVYMILGPHSVFQGSAAFVGSIISGLFVAGTIYFFGLSFRSANAVNSFHEDSFVDAICNLVGGRGVWIVYLLWLALLGLGLWRYLNGFEIALYAVVDEVHMTKSGPGGRRIRVDMAKEPDIEQSIGETDLDVGEEYFLDNSQLQSAAAYIAYRFSKNIEDKDESRIASYGSLVRGVDHGDGWLKVGNRYLPMVIRGVKVVILPQSENAGHDFEDLQPARRSSIGATQIQETKMPSQCSFEDLVRAANDINIHDQTPDHAHLRAVWEASGANLEVAIENLVQNLADQRQGIPATDAEGGRTRFAKTWN